jgi:ribonuclease HII
VDRVAVRPAAGRRRPHGASALFHLEELLWKVGLHRVAGADEVGVGPLAGPVVAAAVVFPPGLGMRDLADSKRLAAAVRERLAVEIRRRAAVGIGTVDVDEIDRVNIYQARMKALRLAVDALPDAPDFVLVDGREIPGLMQRQCAYVRGDSFVASISAASIVAKVHRDALMRDLDRAYPGYGFGRHMGYGTREHLEILRRRGPSPVHRRSFGPVRSGESNLFAG